MNLIIAITLYIYINVRIYLLYVNCINNCILMDGVIVKVDVGHS